LQGYTKFEQLVVECEGHRHGVVPQVVEEFIHVSTEPRRFERPLAMVESLAKADR